jgi:dihydropteroate synthase
MIRILQISDPKNIKQIMHDIKVDPYGIAIMLPKALHYLLRINAVGNITANILKQEMLSQGADTAIARDALTGKAKKTDCLLMGNLSQFRGLNEKLNKQPFGLNKLSQDLSDTLKNYRRDKFILDLGRFRLNLGSRTHIMGIVNLTPDSFSGDGLYKAQSSKLKAQSQILEYVEQLAKDGADIIDLGGESTRPGAKPVSIKEELSRTIPIIKLLARKINLPISIDTYRPEVARQALDCGAVIVNDISGLRDTKMIKVVASYKAGVVIMHMRGEPRTMQKNPRYVSLMDEIINFLSNAVKLAVAGGIDKEKIIVDPGIGFGKTLEHNLKILKSLEELRVLGRPILVGPSRKSFIGKILNVEASKRIFGTVSACVLAAGSGAKIIRAHDVKEVKQALKIFDAAVH